MANVSLIKLVSGEEVIADIKESQGGLELKSPAALMLTQEGLAMIPFVPYAEGNITIKQESVMFVAKPINELLNTYNQKYGSGLVLASNGQIQI